MATALIAAAWLGAIILFVTTVSPTVFGVLTMADASRFLRAYFPRLFQIELVIGGALVFAGLHYAQWWYAMGGFAIAALAAINLWIVMPNLNVLADQMAALSEPDRRLSAQFGRLHGVSAGLFGVGGLLSLWIVVSFWLETA